MCPYYSGCYLLTSVKGSIYNIIFYFERYLVRNKPYYSLIFYSYVVNMSVIKLLSCAFRTCIFITNEWIFHRPSG